MSEHRLPLVVAVPILVVVAAVAALLVWKAITFQGPAHVAGEAPAPTQVAHR